MQYVLSFGLIVGITLILNIAVFWGLDGIVWILQVPREITGLMKEYLGDDLLGGLRQPFSTIILRTFFVRLETRSAVGLLGISAILNIVLDLAFVLFSTGGVQWGSHCHRFFPICLRNRDFDLYMETFSESADCKTACGGMLGF